MRRYHERGANDTNHENDKSSQDGVAQICGRMKVKSV